MATMNQPMSGVAAVDLGLNPAGGYGGNELQGQLAAEIKKRKKKGLMGPVDGNAGMQLLQSANPIGVGQ